MGNKLPLPPLDRRVSSIVHSYHLEVKDIKAIYFRFAEVDVDCNGFWTISECYRFIQETRESPVSPIISGLFDMADRKGNGTLEFQDFLVSFCSFCALSREELLQFMFILIDSDRNGTVEKAELAEFLTTKARGGGKKDTNLYPVNNLQAIDLFHRGQWKHLYFDEFVQLSEMFPYVLFPAFHLHSMLRTEILGKRFWKAWDAIRAPVLMRDTQTKEPLPQRKMKTADGDHIFVEIPTRVPLKDILEYSKRKTEVNAKGLRIEKAEADGGLGDLEIMRAQALRDAQISRCPLFCMIRNPRCGWYVPYVQPKMVREAVNIETKAPAEDEFGEDDDSDSSDEEVKHEMEQTKGKDRTLGKEVVKQVALENVEQGGVVALAKNKEGLALATR